MAGLDSRLWPPCLASSVGLSSQTKVQQCSGEEEGICDIHHSLLFQNYRRQHQWDSSPQESSHPNSTGYSLDQSSALERNQWSPSMYTQAPSS